VIRIRNAHSILASSLALVAAVIPAAAGAQYTRALDAQANLFIRMLIRDDGEQKD
jgi:hypothetical protein